MVLSTVNASQNVKLQAEGSIEKFTCPYHGWTYGLDGRLKKATRLRGIKDFKAKDFGLKSISVKAVGPLVFINLDQDTCDDDFNDKYKVVFDKLNETKFKVT